MTYRPVQNYRGNEADLPQLMAGEIGVTTDTRKLFFGAGGNQEVARVGYVPTMTTADIDYYVAPDGSDETGDGSETKPFKMIQHALDLIPDIIKHNVTINLAPGATFSESIILAYKFGGGITIKSSDKSTINGSGLFRRIISNLILENLDFVLQETITDHGVLSFGGCSTIGVLNTTVNGNEKDITAFYFAGGSHGEVSTSSSALNCKHVIFCTGQSSIFVYDMGPGSGNTGTGLVAQNGIIYKGASGFPSAETAESQSLGGQIFN
ncbi:hypothetical protein [Sporolactobacillus terrae]|uniref:Major tropism determinant N-terminal domain-containing protein n=1 Tax=Sporolactobacillus terrae TaxID=269673 RepID=A0A5K7WT78_9BACL|nr:hypothetical protein [Sporolactobacillus terrae]BBN97512.1 hypothetical protein St703_02170 [Sporolactobacillus terrae]